MGENKHSGSETPETVELFPVVDDFGVTKRHVKRGYPRDIAEHKRASREYVESNEPVIAPFDGIHSLEQFDEVETTTGREANKPYQELMLESITHRSGEVITAKMLDRAKEAAQGDLDAFNELPEPMQTWLLNECEGTERLQAVIEPLLEVAAPKERAKQARPRFRPRHA